MPRLAIRSSFRHHAVAGANIVSPTIGFAWLRGALFCRAQLLSSFFRFQRRWEPASGNRRTKPITPQPHLLLRLNRLQCLHASPAQFLTGPAQAVAADYTRDATSVDLLLGKAVLRTSWDIGIMRNRISTAVLLAHFFFPIFLYADEKPYITTKTPLTLLSANDAEANPILMRTDDGLTDDTLMAQDSFTVIRLGPNDPPICKTVYGTVPCTVIGTPRIAMSADGRFGLITNHDFRPVGSIAYKYPAGTLLTNDDIDKQDLARQDLVSPMANMVSVIDLSCPDFNVTDRILFSDQPMNVLAHPDKRHFVVGASRNFYVFGIDEGKLVEVSRSPHNNGVPTFWINPAGDRIIAAHGDTTQTATIHWYSFSPESVEHLSEVKVLPGVDTQLQNTTAILRINTDGTKALVSQRAIGGYGNLCDVLVVDLTLNPPGISSVIKQVGDGLENFAFHPGGKMAVVACLAKFHNSIAVLDIEASPARVLYYVDAGGFAQGLEFTPDGSQTIRGLAVR